MQAPIIEQCWNHTLPTYSEQQYDLQLLTICGISVLGRWCGQVGEFYVGWSRLLGCSNVQQHPYEYTPTDDHYTGQQMNGGLQ